MFFEANLNLIISEVEPRTFKARISLNNQHAEATGSAPKVAAQRRAMGALISQLVAVGRGDVQPEPEFPWLEVGGIKRAGHSCKILETFETDDGETHHRVQYEDGKFGMTKAKYLARKKF